MVRFAQFYGVLLILNSKYLFFKYEILTLWLEESISRKNTHTYGHENSGVNGQNLQRRS